MGIDYWKSIAEIAGSALTGAAVVIGVIGAYIKFFKGRVFHTRLSLELKHRWLNKDGTHYLVVLATIQNTGVSNVTLLQDAEGEHFLDVYICEAIAHATRWETCQWQRKQTLSLFEKEDNIEAGESISEEQLIVVPNPDDVALKLSLEVRARKSPWRRLFNRRLDYHRWKCETVVCGFDTV